MANSVLDKLENWQNDADSLDTNLPVTATAMGDGQPGDLDGEFRRVKSEIRSESIIKSWERWKGLKNLAVSADIAFTFVNATTFTVNDNFIGTRLVASVGRRVKAFITGATLHGTITAATFSTPNTTITVLWDAGALDATLTEVQFGLEQRSLITPGQSPYFFQQFFKRKTSNQTNNSTTLAQDADLFVNNLAAGFYDFDMQVFFQSAQAAGIQFFLSVSLGATGTWTALFNDISVSPSLARLGSLVLVNGAMNLPSDGTVQVAWVKGTVNFINPLGIFQFAFAQASSAGGGTGIVAGSTLYVRRLS